MGQIATKLVAKYAHEADARASLTDHFEQLEPDADADTSAKTPPNLLKLRCDPRSPSSFERTPLRVAQQAQGDQDQSLLDWTPKGTRG